MIILFLCIIDYLLSFFIELDSPILIHFHNSVNYIRSTLTIINKGFIVLFDIKILPLYG